MIFVSVGTHHLPFNRLLKMINALLISNSINEEVIIQYGTSTVNIKNAVLKNYFSYEDFVDHLRSARLVICQAGPATIFQSIIFADKKPIVIPRLKKYGEHVSDHQLHFSLELKDKNKIILARNEEELKKALIKYKDDRPTWKNDKKLVGKLSQYLSKLNDKLYESK